MIAPISPLPLPSFQVGSPAFQSLTCGAQVLSGAFFGFAGDACCQSRRTRAAFQVRRRRPSGNTGPSRQTAGSVCRHIAVDHGPAGRGPVLSLGATLKRARSAVERIDATSGRLAIEGGKLPFVKRDLVAPLARSIGSKVGSPLGSRFGRSVAGVAVGREVAGHESRSCRRRG